MHEEREEKGESEKNGWKCLPMTTIRLGFRMFVVIFVVEFVFVSSFMLLLDMVFLELKRGCSNIWMDGWMDGCG